MQNNGPILITGAAGFIGSFLVKKFLGSGFQVIGIDNINSYYDKNLKLKRLKNIKEYSIKNNFSWLFYKSNIEDKNHMRKIFLDSKPQIVVNLAAQAGVRYSIVNPSSYVKSNLLGFSNILELCQINDVRHLVYASSSSVYGASKKYPFSEEQKVDTPLSFYAATKISNEMMAHAYSNIYNLPITGLRFFTVYGPWGRPDMATFIFTKKILENKKINIFNYGNMKRDFTYIDDIVKGIKGAVNLKGDYKHKIYNLGNNKPEDLKRFISIIEKNLKVKAKRNLLPIQPGDVAKTSANIDESKRELNFNPKTSIDEGIPKFIEWYKQYYKIK